MDIETTFSRRERQREDISIPRALVDDIEESVRSLGLRTVIEEIDPLAEYPIPLWAPRIVGVPPRTAVALIQWRMARELLDLTWTEGFEAHISIVRRAFGAWRSLADWRGRLPREQREVRRVVQLLSQAEKAYRAWLAKSWESLSTDVREWYQWRVGDAYDDQAFIRKYCTEYGRSEARRLKGKALGKDASVAGLREKLRIPHDGFQDAEEAARWLYDRLPVEELEAPDGPLTLGLFLYGFGPPVPIGTAGWAMSWGTIPVRIGITPTPTPSYGPRMQVPVLVEAARLLRKKHRLKPDWNEVLSIYVLRGELRPPISRKRWGKGPTISKRDAYLLDLLGRHSYHRTRIMYTCGVSEAEFLDIVEAHPGATERDLEDLCMKLAEKGGGEQAEDITHDQLRKIKWRWGGLG